MPDFVSFNEFLDKTASAKYENHRDALRWSAMNVAQARGFGGPGGLGADSSEAEFEKMKEHILARYKGVRATHTFLDVAGNHVDCIPFDQQATVRSAKAAGHEIQMNPPAPAGFETPPAADPTSFGPQTTSVVPPLRRGLVDMYGNQVACPADSVPLRRLTLERLTRSGTLDRFFRKGSVEQFKRRNSPAGGPALPLLQGGDGSWHRHAIAQDSRPNIGGGSWMNLWDPALSPDTTMTLSQLWIVGNDQQTPGRGPLQTIEGGWMVQPGLFSTTLASLFVFFNPDGYGPQSGYLMNQQLHGFVISPGTPWVLGGAFGQSSAMSGAQVGFWMGWQRDPSTGNWFLFLGSSPSDATSVGYFPQFLYAGGVIGQGADVIQFGGEVASPSTQNMIGPMGSGVHPSGTAATEYQKVAFHNHVSILQPGQTTYQPAALVAMSTQDDPPFGMQTGSSSNWGSYFFFGG